MAHNPDINEILRDAEFKDERPLKTVEKIKNILKENGIETEEHWFESGVPYCYSLRVTVVGTTFGVNGKGLTKEFAWASGYGELMERLQLGYTGSKEVQKDGTYSRNDSQDELLTVDQLLDDAPGRYEALAKGLHHYTGVEEAPRTLLTQYADRDGMISATPYYNVTKQKRDYFPAALRKHVYTSNGCAAGNTMEEAIVQAISEIVERHHQLRIIGETLALPDVPDEVLRQYETAWNIISYVRSMGFKVAIKDCSLGTKYPVVCAAFINQKTGKYHTHFGAYPIFEIALERALTETFQGQNIDTIAKFDDFVYNKSDANAVIALANELWAGTWQKSPVFFVGEPKYDWNGDVGFKGKNNRELMQECLRFFADQGYDVLIRDASCLGFPTYQILVPGYSEIFSYRLSRKLDDNRFLGYAVKTLRDPAKASMEDMIGMARHLAQVSKLPTTSKTHGFRAWASLSAQLDVVKENKLLHASLAYVFYTLGNLREALDYVSKLVAADKHDEYLICLKRWLSLQLTGYSKEQTKAILEYFHLPETVEKLLSCEARGKNPLEDYVLHCDMKCSESCLLHGCCYQKRIDELAALVSQKSKELDFDTFANAVNAVL